MDIFKIQAVPSTGLAQGAIAPKPPPTTWSKFKTSLSTPGSTLRTVAMIGGFLLVAYIVYYYVVPLFTGKGSSAPTGEVSDAEDLIPAALDGKVATTIASAKLPVGDGNNYGLNFWLFIKDWDFNFGKEKTIFSRGAGNPTITLHPTDNSLNVKVAIYPAGTTTSTTNAAGDVYTCTVENVPLQAWFAVSVTVFQRNLDIYINGQLVKSCVLPGVPKLASGDATIGSTTTGFSGNVCTMKYLPRGLVPSDAMSFFSAGTGCGTPGGSKTPAEGITIFGYTFTFSIFKKGQKEPTYTLSNR